MKNFVICLLALIVLASAKWYKYDYKPNKANQELAAYKVIHSKDSLTIKLLYNINEQIHHKYDSLLILDSKCTTVTCTQYYPTGGKTASDYVIPKGYTQRHAKYKIIAVSHDLLKKNGGFLEFGDKIKVIGTPSLDGVYHVEDTTHKRFRNRVDILVSPGFNEMYKNIKITKV